MSKLIPRWILFFSGLLLVGYSTLDDIERHAYLREVMNFLAGGEMEGRRPGTDGNRRAVEFLREELVKMDIPHLPGLDTYKQYLTIFIKMVKDGENLVRIPEYPDKTVPFEPLSFSKSGILKNREVVFAGFGITVPPNNLGLVYDDYRGIDVKGKIVAVFTSDPAVGNKNSLFRDPSLGNFRSVHYKINNAARHGAAGLLLLQDPMSLDEDGQETLAFHEFDGGGVFLDILSGQITNEWLSGLLGQEDVNRRYFKNTRELQKRISTTQRPLSFIVKNLKLDMKVHLKKSTGRIANVIAFLPGSDPRLKEEIVVLGAHFDHLGLGGSSSLEPSGTSCIHHGADDNASGSSMVLELARRLRNGDNRRSLLFTFFNAEEMGLLGSRHFARSWKRLGVGTGKIVAMINFDMIGRYRESVAVLGIGSSHEWKDILTGTHQDMSVFGNHELEWKFEDTVLGSSDHYPFLENGIPSLFFSTGGHEDYHRCSNTVDKINFEAMVDIADFVETFLGRLDLHKAPTFNPDSLKVDPSGGGGHKFAAFLGCVPDFSGGSGVTGVACTKAVSGSPAAKAGIIPGDVLTRIGEVELKNIYDLAFALRFYRPFDQVLLEWKRGSELMQREIILAKRK